MKINLGGGKKRREGFTNIDSDKEVNPDIVADLEKGIPLEDNSVSHIYSAHFLEHIKPKKWLWFLDEIQRVAKNGCILELDLPFDHIGTRTMIAHYRTFGYSSFDTLTVNKEMEDTERRSCYTKLKLINLLPRPTLIRRLFLYTFPFLKNEIKFKFEIVKG